MKKTYYFLLIAFCGLSTGFAQSDSLYSEKTSLKTLPSLKQVVYSATPAVLDHSLALDLGKVNLINHSLQNIKDGDFAISVSNLKMKNFFNRNDFRTKPADMLENIMPDYDLTSKPLPAQPLF